MGKDGAVCSLALKLKLLPYTPPPAPADTAAEPPTPAAAVAQETPADGAESPPRGMVTTACSADASAPEAGEGTGAHSGGVGAAREAFSGQGRRLGHRTDAPAPAPARRGAAGAAGGRGVGGARHPIVVNSDKEAEARLRALAAVPAPPRRRPCSAALRRALRGCAGSG